MNHLGYSYLENFENNDKLKQLLSLYTKPISEKVQIQNLSRNRYLFTK